jgi:hypothetical protein
MNRAFRQGYLEVGFPAEPFSSSARLLLETVRLFASRFGLIAAVTLAVFLPGKLLLQWMCELADITTGGLLSYALLEASDLILGALAVPAVVYGLVAAMPAGRVPAMSECLWWGRRQWAKMLWNKFKVEITVMLWGALLVIPGIIAMIRLIFTDIIVAVEADREPDPMGRSRDLSQGRRWRIFLVLAPMMLADMAATFLILDRIPGATNSRILFAASDSILNVLGQLTTVAALLMYLGMLPPGKKSQS